MTITPNLNSSVTNIVAVTPSLSRGCSAFSAKDEQGFDRLSLTLHYLLQNFEFINLASSG
jgi:hypothetical protein